MKELEEALIEFLRNQLHNPKGKVKLTVIEGELINIIKGVEYDEELFLVTGSGSLGLHNMKTSLFELKEIHNGMYKVIWSPTFWYLIGDEERSKDVTASNTLRLLKESASPLTNYLQSALSN